MANLCAECDDLQITFAEQQEFLAAGTGGMEESYSFQCLRYKQCPHHFGGQNHYLKSVIMGYTIFR